MNTVTALDICITPEANGEYYVEVGQMPSSSVERDITVSGIELWDVTIGFLPHATNPRVTALWFGCTDDECPEAGLEELAQDVLRAAQAIVMDEVENTVDWPHEFHPRHDSAAPMAQQAADAMAYERSLKGGA